LNVPVDDLVPMAEFQRCTNVGCYLERTSWLQAAFAGEQLLQGLAVDELHDDEGQTLAVGSAFIPGVVYRHDGRVVQRSGVLSLTPKSRLKRRVSSKISPEHLDRNIPAQAQVTAPVHFGHAAVAQQLADLISTTQETWLGHERVPGRKTLAIGDVDF